MNVDKRSDNREREYGNEFDSTRRPLTGDEFGAKRTDRGGGEYLTAGVYRGVVKLLITGGPFAVI
jgi:hypothetical protein